MRTRVLTPTAPDFPRYGGRGIKICQQWDDFVTFLADMGDRPANTSLDRVDVNGDYTPENCRWATPAQQMHNRRCTKLDHASVMQIRWLAGEGGYTHTRIGKAFGVSQSMVSRICSGQYWKEGT